MEGGYRKALEIFQTGEKPDAFFCASNEMAFGILRAARHSGIAVPKELSITGFTDSPIAKLAEPPLTTLEQPIRQLGAVLIRTLLDLIHSNLTPNSSSRNCFTASFMFEALPGNTKIQLRY